MRSWNGRDTPNSGEGLLSAATVTERNFFRSLIDSSLLSSTLNILSPLKVCSSFASGRRAKAY